MININNFLSWRDRLSSFQWDNGRESDSVTFNSTKLNCWECVFVSQQPWNLHPQTALRISDKRLRKIHPGAISRKKKYIIISKFVSKTYENCQARVGMFGLMSLPFQSVVDFPSSDDVLVLPLMFSDHKRQLLLWQLRKSSSLHQFLKLILGRLKVCVATLKA